MPIKITKTDQVCATGAAMFAATAAGLFDSVRQARDTMGSGFENVFKPDTNKSGQYNIPYKNYLSLGDVIEKRIQEY